MDFEPEDLAPSTCALIDAMIAGASAVKKPPVEARQWVAYAMEALPAGERADLEGRAAREAGCRTDLWEVWDRVESFRRLPLSAIERDPVGEAYLQILSRPVAPPTKGLADLLREGGDAARLAWTTLSAALKTATAPKPSFAPVFRFGGAQLVLEESSQFAELAIEDDALLITLPAPEGDRLFVALELGEHRLSLGIAEAANGEYRLPIDPAVIGKHRLVARWDAWPARADAPLVQIEGDTSLTLVGIPEIEDGKLRIPVAWSQAEPRAVDIDCAFAPGLWQYLGQRNVSSDQRHLEVDYPGSGGAFPWPLRLTVQRPV